MIEAESTVKTSGVIFYTCDEEGNVNFEYFNYEDFSPYIPIEVNFYTIYPYDEYQCYLVDTDSHEIGMARDAYTEDEEVTTYYFNVNDYSGECKEYSAECDQYYEELDYGDLFYNETLYTACGLDWYELTCDLKFIVNKGVISVQGVNGEDDDYLEKYREETRGKFIVLPQRIPDRITDDFTTTCTLEARYAYFPFERVFAKKTFNVTFYHQ